MKRKLDGRAAERMGGDCTARRMLAVGKRVKNRWLIEMSLTRRTVAPAVGGDAGHARAA